MNREQRRRHVVFVVVELDVDLDLGGRDGIVRLRAIAGRHWTPPPS
jgi:hypothetical protein